MPIGGFSAISLPLEARVVILSTGTGGGVGTGSGVGEGTGLGTGEGTGLGTGDGAGDGEGLGLIEGLGDGAGLGLIEGLGDILGDGLGEGDISGDILVALALILAFSLGLSPFITEVDTIVGYPDGTAFETVADMLAFALGDMVYNDTGVEIRFARLVDTDAPSELGV